MTDETVYGQNAQTLEIHKLVRRDGVILSAESDNWDAVTHKVYLTAAAAESLVVADPGKRCGRCWKV